MYLVKSTLRFASGYWRFGLGGRFGVEVGAADVFSEMVMRPFLGFDGIIPDSSSPATV